MDLRPAKAVIYTLATMRLIRFVTTDDVPGQWWIKDPLLRRVRSRQGPGGAEPAGPAEPAEPAERWWHRYLEGLDCPYCVGVWAAAGITVGDYFLGKTRLWNAALTALALSEAAAHAGVFLGDHPAVPTFSQER